MKIIRVFKMMAKLVAIGLSIGVCELLLATNAHAQNKFVLEPAQLTVSGMGGTVVTRNIVLQTVTPINNLQLIPLDLQRNDGDSVFPAQAISVGKSAVSSANQNVITTLVNFHLKQVSRSGEFTGKLLLSYADGEYPIPITVKVKDPWLFPLIMLFVGTGLGVCASLYRAQGRPRDEVLVRVSQLRTQIQDDTDLSKFKAFQARIEAQLIDVKMALQGERWDEARNAVQQAELVGSKWLKGRADWLAQVAYSDEIKQRLQDMNHSLPFVQASNRSLEDMLREAPDLESPVRLRDKLKEIAEQVNAYILLRSKMKQLASLSVQLSVEQAKSWQSQIQSLEERMAILQPTDLTKETTLLQDVENAIAQITPLLSQQEEMLNPTEIDFQVGARGALAKGLSSWGLTLPLLGPAPSAHALNWEKSASVASWRLQMFRLSGYAIAIAFLTGAGFNQLYVDNPTFGANPWKDYFALMAWGFGAEATRDTVTKVLKEQKLIQ